MSGYFRPHDALSRSLAAVWHESLIKLDKNWCSILNVPLTTSSHVDWGGWISRKNDRIVHSNSARKNAEPSVSQTSPIMWKHVVHMSSNNCCRIWYYSESPYLKLTTVFAEHSVSVISWHSSHGRGPRLDHRRYVTIRTYQGGDQTGVTVTTLPLLSYIHSTLGHTQGRQSRVIRVDIFSALGKVRNVQQMILLSRHHPDH